MAASLSDDDTPITGINVTPLVDVCLVLVIIFMVTAPLFVQPGLTITLPRAQTVEGEERENIAVTITADGRWAVNEQEAAPAQVPALLSERLRRSREKLVILKMDRQARHGWLVEAMGLAKSLGARSVTIATEQKRTGS